MTTAKGKLCAEVCLARHSPTRLLIDADAALREPLPARLERYIIADDVTLEDVTDDLRLLHFLGDVAPARDLRRDAAICADRAHRFGRDGWDFVLLPTAAFDTAWPQLIATVADPRRRRFRRRLRIEAGVPRWGRELGEDTLPPEAGLDRTHIDYHKGCYIGQEVISRLKSVGHVNRQLTGFVSDDGAPLAAGAQLFAPGDDERPVGTLTSAAFSFALEKPIALGYLKRGSPIGGLLARTADAPARNPRRRPRHCPSFLMKKLLLTARRPRRSRLAAGARR